ncbi:MAG: exodeoxyribonuclease VII large subunit [Candidatus Moranbacteria bacterium]|nr:exodeoxyribonuclease VII large subunit [Candidatus Moranbacteria bacterium]
MADTLSLLRMWRAKKAAREGVEPFRVLTNAALEGIAVRMPRTPDELMEVKGIKDAKCRLYGKEILEIVSRAVPASQAVVADVPFPDEVPFPDGPESSGPEEDAVSVSRFLDGLNTELSGMAARIRGEVSSVDERDRVVYFSLKDPEDGSMMNCLIFRFQYDVSGVRIKEGDEVIVEGVPEIWKPMGRLSLKVGLIEVAGEGALKKAYDALYRKLEAEGVFAEARKRPLPQFPERIALITSEQGAAIGDFLTNIGSLGIRIDLYPSSVEGKRAVFEVLDAIRRVRARADRYDLLVVVRGGGSIESLQAFNTESLVREIALCEMPVIAGIGHEKDITLSALAADRMVSTPTAAARTIREPFERARQSLAHHERILLDSFGATLSAASDHVEESVGTFLGFLEGVSIRFERARSALSVRAGLVEFRIRESRSRVDAMLREISNGWKDAGRDVRERLVRAESALRQYDPNRVLALGYGLVRLANGALLRKSTDTKVGDRLDIRLSEGRIVAEVREFKAENEK